MYITTGFNNDCVLVQCRKCTLYRFFVNYIPAILVFSWSDESNEQKHTKLQYFATNLFTMLGIVGDTVLKVITTSIIL